MDVFDIMLLGRDDSVEGCEHCQHFGRMCPIVRVRVVLGLCKVAFPCLSQMPSDKGNISLAMLCRD